MTEHMNITQAQYKSNEQGVNTSIKATIDDIYVSVPLAEGNRHYDEITRQVAEGTLTIEEAE